MDTLRPKTTQISQSTLSALDWRSKPRQGAEGGTRRGGAAEGTGREARAVAPEAFTRQPCRPSGAAATVTG